MIIVISKRPLMFAIISVISGVDHVYVSTNFLHSSRKYILQ